MSKINLTIQTCTENSICFGCLSYDRKIIPCAGARDHLKSLCNIFISDETDVFMCWQCSANIRQITKFQQQISHSYNILSDYTNLDKILKDPQTLNIYTKVSLTISPIESAHFVPGDDIIKTGIESGKDSHFERNNANSKYMDLKSEQGDEMYDDGTHVEENIANNEISISAIAYEDIDKNIGKLKNKSSSKIMNIARKKTSKKIKCYLCRSQFESYTKLKEHKNLCDEAKGQNVICDFCNRSFISKNKLIHHLRIMSNRPHTEPKCNICNQVFRTKNILRMHSQIHEGQVYSCDLCQQKFQWKRNLWRHMKCHKDRQAGKLYECTFCESKLTSLASYKEHIGRHKEFCGEVSDITDNDNPHTCELCHRKFQTEISLKRHTKWHADRAAGKIYECRICDTMLTSVAAYLEHNNTYKEHQIRVRYKCEKCNDSFTSKQRLADHVDWVHLKNVNYRCTSCHKVFQTSFALTKHVRYAHEANSKDKHKVPYKYLCDICGKSFQCSSVLQDHKTVHNDTSKFECDVCGKLFKKKSSLRLHTNMHKDMFLCQICGKSFCNWSNKERHVKYVHKEIRDVKCDHCEKCFKSDADKKLHTKYVHLNYHRPKRVSSIEKRTTK